VLGRGVLLDCALGAGDLLLVLGAHCVSMEG
jgi:hypothetical protein